MTLTYDLDLETWPRYPSTWPTYRNPSLYVCPFGRESGNTQTHTQKHRRCQNYYTRQVTDVGCNNSIHIPNHIGSPFRKIQAYSQTLSWSSAYGFAGDPVSMACGNIVTNTHKAFWLSMSSLLQWLQQKRAQWCFTKLRYQTIWKKKKRNILILPIGILNFCKQWRTRRWLPISNIWYFAFADIRYLQKRRLFLYIGYPICHPYFYCIVACCDIDLQHP